MDEYNGLKPKQDYIILKNELNDCNFRNSNFDSFESNLNISDIKDEYQKAQEEKITLKQEKKMFQIEIIPTHHLIKILVQN